MNTAEATRADLLAALGELSRVRPEWRLGQLIANLAMVAGQMNSAGVWDLEDAEALAAAKTLLEQHSELEPVVAEPNRCT